MGRGRTVSGPHYWMDSRGLALSDLLETYFYLETKSGTCLYSVLFCSSVISYVYVLMSYHIAILQGWRFGMFHIWKTDFLHFSHIFLDYNMWPPAVRLHLSDITSGGHALFTSLSWPAWAQNRHMSGAGPPQRTLRHENEKEIPVYHMPLRSCSYYETFVPFLSIEV